MVNEELRKVLEKVFLSCKTAEECLNTGVEYAYIMGDMLDEIMNERISKLSSTNIINFEEYKEKHSET